MVSLVPGERVTVEGAGLSGRGVVAKCTTHVSKEEVVFWSVDLFMEEWLSSSQLSTFLVRGQRDNEYVCSACQLNDDAEMIIQRGLDGRTLRTPGRRNILLQAELTANTPGAARRIRDDWSEDPCSLLDEMLS